MFAFLYENDNKYTQLGACGSQGRLVLPDSQEELLVPLVYGWEFYPEKLYDPADFASGITEEPYEIYIGQHLDMTNQWQDLTPSGYSTYRMVLFSGKESRNLCLKLSDVFSTGKVWINGRQAGNEDVQYQPFTQNRIEPFVMNDQCEIVIQMANYTSYLGGMGDLPVIGTVQAIYRMQLIKAVIYGLMFFSSLTVAIFSIAVWLRMIHDRLYRYFGIMTLCFAVSVVYPLWGWLGISNITAGVMIQNLSAFTVMLCVVGINQVGLGLSPKDLFCRIVMVLSAVFCVVSVVLPLLMFPSGADLMRWYNRFVYGYKLMVSAFLFYALVKGIRTRPALRWMIAGNMVYGTGLAIETLSKTNFEPMYGAWHNEYSGFVMVVLFAVMMVRYNQITMYENDRLNTHLEEEVSRRTKQLTSVLQERKRMLTGLAHDLKAPVSAIQTYMELIQIGHLTVERELENYLQVIEQKVTDIQKRVEVLQLFSSYDVADLGEKERIDLKLFLQEIYENNLPDAEANGIYFKLCIGEEEAFVMAWRDKLTSTIENIIYNAISFMPEGGIIMLAVFCHDSWVDVSISDTGEGILPENLPHVFDENFSTRDAQGQPINKRGMGLYLAQMTVREIGGYITVNSEPGEGAEFNICLPLAQ